MKRLLGLKFGSSRRLTLHGFALGSAAEVLDDDAGEEGYGVEVGFSFGKLGVRVHFLSFFPIKTS